MKKEYFYCDICNDLIEPDKEDNHISLRGVIRQANYERSVLKSDEICNRCMIKIFEAIRIIKEDSYSKKVG